MVVLVTSCLALWGEGGACGTGVSKGSTNQCSPNCRREREIQSRSNSKAGFLTNFGLMPKKFLKCLLSCCVVFTGLPWDWIEKMLRIILTLLWNLITLGFIEVKKAPTEKGSQARGCLTAFYAEQKINCKLSKVSKIWYLCYIKMQWVHTFCSF